MIKKFNEYFKESKDIEGIVSKEDLDDHFLRLKEIFYCKIYYDYLSYDIIYISIDSMNCKKVGYIEEMDQIKRRLESIYGVRVSLVSKELELDKLYSKWRKDRGFLDNKEYVMIIKEK